MATSFPPFFSSKNPYNLYDAYKDLKDELARAAYANTGYAANTTGYAGTYASTDIGSGVIVNADSAAAANMYLTDPDAWFLLSDKDKGSQPVKLEFAKLEFLEKELLLVLDKEAKKEILPILARFKARQEEKDDLAKVINKEVGKIKNA